MNSNSLTRVFTLFSLFSLLVLAGCGGEASDPAAGQSADPMTGQPMGQADGPAAEQSGEQPGEPVAETATQPSEEKPAGGTLADRALRQLVGERVDASAGEEQAVIPSAKLSDSPGAPMVIEEIVEQSGDVPLTVPIVDPTVTNPTPTVTNTPIPTTLLGLTYSGGQSGGPLGNAVGDGAANNEGKGGTVVFGPAGTARKVAFIVDLSGSMVDVQPFVINELKRALQKLQKGQDATIIVFSGEGVYEVPGGKGLRAVTDDYKKAMGDWLDKADKNFEVGSRGDKNAERAIRRALSYQPQLVFVLSDALVRGDDVASHERAQDKLMKSINEANKAERPTKFNTIQFLYEDPLDRAGKQGTLRRLADETNGRYRFVSAKELGLK